MLKLLTLVLLDQQWEETGLGILILTVEQSFIWLQRSIWERTIKEPKLMFLPLVLSYSWWSWLTNHSKAPKLRTLITNALLKIDLIYFGDHILKIDQLEITSLQSLKTYLEDWWLLTQMRESPFLKLFNIHGFNRLHHLLRKFNKITNRD